ncbi:MAG: endonuclease/exonuclease/phosphatase family protein [bacterium]|nr:endonuclease/exonuclease/phosphatase family protein [bacterium]
MNFSVLTYNVLFNKAFNELGIVIKASHPDVICIQEIDTEESNLEKIEKLGYKLADYSNSFIHFGTIFGVATFYNPESCNFTGSSTLQLPRSIYEIFLLVIRLLRGGNEPRTVLKTDFTFQSNKRKITIYNTHLTVLSTNQGRVKQMKKVIDFIQNYKETPLIITGDFNYHPYGRKQLETLMKENELNEATSSLDYTMQLNPTGKFENYNFIQRLFAKIVRFLFNDRFKLDYMYYKNLKLINTKRIDIRLSDHYPIIGKFSL